ncbi:MAG: ammonia-forming cytochrome c nitrite reductase subunit c552 [Anaerolineae bacterium]|nr:ammonia-forming cytochrome c nitrite reductase subunit c552 [Anaerolineae bacterium]
MLLTMGFSLLWLQQMPVVAQDSVDLSDADYMGAGECSSCHRELSRTHDDSLHVLTLQDTSRDKDAILGDFNQGEETRQVLFPDSDAPRAFSQDDIAYVVGSGRYVQRYLYEVDRDDYRVLPAEWDVTAGAWRPLNLAEAWEDPAYDWETSCAYCHTTGLNVERGRWEDDGVQCEACHGPGSIHEELASDAGRRPDEEELLAIRAAINPAIDPQVCGQCHSRGQNADGLPFPAGYIPGTNLADVFSLVTLDQTDHWWVTGHARQMNMQYNEWIDSGHATSLSDLRLDDEADDSCLTCHSSDYSYNMQLAAAIEAGDREGSVPQALTLDTAQFGITCAGCHNPHTESGLDALMVEETYPLCTSCHSDNNTDTVHHPVQEMFEGRDFIEGVSGFTGVHFATENGPTCATCHLPQVPVEAGAERTSHTFQPVLAFDVEGLGDSCSSCHEESSPQAMGQLIAAIQTDTQARIETARALINESTPIWVVRALDFVEGDGSLGIHNYSYSDALLDAIYEELGLYTAEAGQ